MTASLSRERKKRPGDESHHNDRGGRLRSTRARRRRAPVAATGTWRAAAHALFKRRARPLACHTSKQTHNKHHQKITLDAKESRKDPVQHGLVDPSTSYK